MKPSRIEPKPIEPMLLESESKERLKNLAAIAAYLSIAGLGSHAKKAMQDASDRFLLQNEFSLEELIENIKGRQISVRSGHSSSHIYVDGKPMYVGLTVNSEQIYVPYNTKAGRYVASELADLFNPTILLCLFVLAARKIYRALNPSEEIRSAHSY